MKTSTCVFSVTLLLLVVSLSVVSGLQCYSCGTYIETSVTPCRNFTKSSLIDCPTASTHCAKYVGPAVTVYDCATNCEDKTQKAFEIYCCSKDMCNSSRRVYSSSRLTIWSGAMVLLAGWFTSRPCWPVVSFFPSLA